MQDCAYINVILGWDFGRVYIANTFTTLIDRFTSDAFKGFIKLIKFESEACTPAQSIIWTLKIHIIKYNGISELCQLKKRLK